jgi:hypothetical protein
LPSISARFPRPWTFSSACPLVSWTRVTHDPVIARGCFRHFRSPAALNSPGPGACMVYSLQRSRSQGRRVIRSALSERPRALAIRCLGGTP